MPRTRLLIDGDIVAYSQASASERICYDHDLVYPVASKKLGMALCDNVIAGLKIDLKADEVEVYLSDPKRNWRRELVDPTYKTNRVALARPLLLDVLKDYLRFKHGATHWAGLEADDVLSLLATNPPANIPSVVYGPTRNIIVGRDKDFKSIPGLHHAWQQDAPGVVREITPWQAERFHLMQALAGDRVDGFYGCPGIGMERAARIIDSPVLLVPTDGVKTRGVNKGDSVTRWVSEPTNDYWACIVSHYKKQGLTEDDALRTARMARLLRHGEYDREAGSVKLWEPSMIETRR